MAQSIVQMDAPKESYFYNQWVETNKVATDVLRMDGENRGGKHVEHAVGYYTPDSMEVRGLALAIHASVDRPDSSGHFCEYEEATDSLSCLVRLSVRDGDTLRVLAEQEVNMLTTPIAYRMALNKKQFNKVTRNRDTLNVDTVPVYECFFEQPVMVKDTFYVGYYYNKKIYSPYDSLLYGITVNSYMDFPLRTAKEPILLYDRFEREDGYRTYFKKKYFEAEYYFMYAITGQDDDPGDTTGISRADMVSRYVTVQPNPATEEAQVLSSFGIERIDAYTADGRCILRQEANGLQATLDVRGWASGTYLLRVATPMGTATKKLLVR